MSTAIQTISSKAFSKFGKVIEFSPDFNDRFEILLHEDENPWRIAVFRYTEKSTDTFENHPYSMESFEPLNGETILIVAEHDTPDKYQAFLLNKPVCLYKGVWHQVISLTDEAQVKITENKEVSSKFFTLKKPIHAVMSSD